MTSIHTYEQHIHKRRTIKQKCKNKHTKMYEPHTRTYEEQNIQKRMNNAFATTYAQSMHKRMQQIIHKRNKIIQHTFIKQNIYNHSHTDKQTYTNMQQSFKTEYKHIHNHTKT